MRMLFNALLVVNTLHTVLAPSAVYPAVSSPSKGSERSAESPLAFRSKTASQAAPGAVIGYGVASPSLRPSGLLLTRPTKIETRIALRELLLHCLKLE